MSDTATAQKYRNLSNDTHLRFRCARSSKARDILIIFSLLLSAMYTFIAAVSMCTPR